MTGLLHAVEAENHKNNTLLSLSRIPNNYVVIFNATGLFNLLKTVRHRSARISTD